MPETYGPPLPLRKGKGGTLKIKRGGTGKVSNSGNAAGRFHAPVRALRDAKTGKHLPQPPRGKPIWNPMDPFIIEYQRARNAMPVRVLRGSHDHDLQSGPTQGPWFDPEAKASPHPQLQETRDRIEAYVVASRVDAIDDQMKAIEDAREYPCEYPDCDEAHCCGKPPEVVSIKKVPDGDMGS